MVKPSVLMSVFALLPTAIAQCGSGTPNAKVTGSGSSFTATKGSSTVYTGADYRAAVQAAVDSISQSSRTISLTVDRAPVVAFMAGNDFESSN